MPDNVTNSNFKIGVLGGGQLGKMLALAAANWDVQLWMLDRSASFPAGVVAHHFVEGNFKDYDDVYRFGKQVDMLTIEIEHVNTEALLQLEKEGLTIHPAPQKLQIIQDKGLQKQFYKKHGLPTASFELYKDKNTILEAVKSGKIAFPFVQKSRTAGYDGRGVAVVQNADDLPKLMDTPSVIEPKVAIRKELAVVVARNPSGAIEAFPVVEMEFHPTANLVEYLLCPAQIPEVVAQKATQIALQTIQTFDICGLLAVELFWTQAGDILINEVAPRPHNSGHHTIDSCYTSQFQQHLRAIMDLPLGSTHLKTPAVMVNILGAAGHTGIAHYEGFADAMGIEGIHLHLYGKQQTKPFRKMGHATFVGDTLEIAHQRAALLKEKLTVITTQTKPMTEPIISIIMGSDSDLPVMRQAADFLKDLNIPFELTIVSAHRTPQRMFDFAQDAHYRGIKVIIAGAGGAAHLPGMVASLTPLPVIGVPIKSSNSIDGWDSILSILQMPNGIPVATVALNAAKNAGILAAKIIGTQDETVQKKVQRYMENLTAAVTAKYERLEREGYEQYKK